MTNPENTAAHPISRAKLLALAATWVTVTACDRSKYNNALLNTNLGLTIDQDAFAQAIVNGPEWNFLPFNVPKLRHCPAWLENVCFSNTSTNLILALNQPMTETMAQQTDLVGLPLPTQITFYDNWGLYDRPNIIRNGVEGGFTITSNANQLQYIAIWNKIAAFMSFRDLDRYNLPVDRFPGVMSYFLSSFMLHEMAHAGREFKALGQRTRRLKGHEEKIHSQIYTFQAGYQTLWNKAAQQGNSEAALLIGVSPSRIDLEAYRSQLYQQAQAFGIPF